MCTFIGNSLSIKKNNKKTRGLLLLVCTKLKKFSVPACSFLPTRTQSVDLREKTSWTTSRVLTLSAQINKWQHISFVRRNLTELTIVAHRDATFVLFDHNKRCVKCVFNNCVMSWKRCRCGGLPRLRELFIAAEGPFSAVQEGRAPAWTFLFTFRSNCLSQTLWRDASLSVLLLYSKHSFASDMLIKSATLPRAAGTAAPGPEFNDIPPRHQTHHKTWRTKERQQREARLFRGPQRRPPLFHLSHLTRRCQTTVISSKRCWLTESIHSNLHPTNFQMLRLHFGYNGRIAEKGEDKPRGVKSDSGTWKHRIGKRWIQAPSSCRWLFSTRVLLRVYFSKILFRPSSLKAHTVFNRYQFEAEAAWLGDVGSISPPRSASRVTQWHRGKYGKYQLCVCMQWEVQQITHLAVRSSVHLLIKQFSNQTTIWVEHKLN